MQMLKCVVLVSSQNDGELRCLFPALSCFPCETLSHVEPLEFSSWSGCGGPCGLSQCLDPSCHGPQHQRCVGVALQKVRFASKMRRDDETFKKHVTAERSMQGKTFCFFFVSNEEAGASRDCRLGMLQGPKDFCAASWWQV